MGFSWCSRVVKLSSPLESFSWRWAGRLWFLAIFPSPLLGAPTFLLYSPSWLILALHLLVKQMLISVSIPSIVPSYFLLVAKIEIYTVQTSFLINRIWALADAFNAEGTHFPWSNPTPCFPMGPLPLTSPSGGCLGIASTKMLAFSLKLWDAEDRVVSQPFPLTPRPSIIRPRQNTSSARALGLDRVWAGLQTSRTHNYKTKMKNFCYILGKVNIKSKKMRLFI